MGSRKTIQITDTLHGTINLMPLEKEIISTQIFNRLHNISQNSTVYLTFPANRTKRFEHSIGTMELCGEIYCNALGNADKKTIDQFFYEIHQVISKILDKIMGKNASAYRNIVGDRNLQSKRNLQAILNSIGQDINQSIYSTYSKSIPYNIEEKDVGAYIIVFQAIRISALLHDVGHPPFSHIVESALNEIYQEVIRIDPFSRNNRQKEFIEIMKNYFEDGSQLHERIGHIISDKILDSLMVPLEVSTIPDEDKLSWQLFQVMIKEFVSYIFYEKYPICKNIHAIIDGPLDGDRLDYVARDPINSGLHTGKIEYERLFNSIRLIEFEGDFFFAPATKSIDTIEDFFNRRWDLYKRIIFHHRVIKTDYLLHDCVKELSLRYLEKEVEEEEEEMGILPYDISGIWKAIRHNPSHEVFFDSLIQWDDGWLMTILKKHYFEDFREDTSNDILKFKLEELLANKKYYYSIIKKPEDFNTIENAIRRVILEHYDLMIEKINHMPSGHFFNDIKNWLQSIKQDTMNGFVLHPFIKILNYLPGEKIRIQDIVKESLLCTTSIQYDTIFEVKSIKPGLDKSIMLYNIKGNRIEVKNFTELSSQKEILMHHENFLPPFYLYIKKEKEYIDYEKIKEEVGTLLGQKIVDIIMRKL